MAVQWNSQKMKMMTGVVYNFLECSLRTIQCVTVLCEVKCVDQLLDQQLTGWDDESEEEVAGDETTVLDALNRIGSTRKVHVLVLYWGQYYCNVQQSWKWTIQTENSGKKETNDSYWLVKETTIYVLLHLHWCVLKWNTHVHTCARAHTHTHTFF